MWRRAAVSFPYKRLEQWAFAHCSDFITILLHFLFSLYFPPETEYTNIVKNDIPRKVVSVWMIIPVNSAL